MLKRLLLLIVFGCCFILAKGQQAAQFSQYVFNGLYINPAYAGYKEDLYVNSFYRSQWTGLDGAPQTQSITADGALNNGKVGLGIMVDHDEIGAQSNIAAYGNYAYRVQLGSQENSKLAFGLGFGFIQSGIDGTKLSATQTNDAYIPAGYESVLLPDARFGVLYTNDHFFAGVSVDNILAQYIHSSQVNALLVPVPKPTEYVTVGALFSVSDQTKIKPSILFKNSPGSPASIDLNTYVLLNERLWIGGTYRTTLGINQSNLQSGYQKSSAMVFMVEFYARQSFRIGYAFDYSLNQIGNYGYGSHELSVSFLLRRNKNSHNALPAYF